MDLGWNLREGRFISSWLIVIQVVGHGQEGACCHGGLLNAHEYAS